MHANTFIHVGLPKAASTTIQQNLFAALDNVTYISRPDNAGNHHDLYEKISFSISRNIRVLNSKELWETFTDTVDSDILLFSDERITLPGGSQSTPLIARPSIMFKIFGESKILLVLRDPLTFLRSYYHQHCIVQFNKFNNHPIQFSDWLDQDLEQCIHTNGARCQIVFFADILKQYHDTFGKKNVNVFFFEDIISNSKFFFKSIQNAIGINGNYFLDASTAPKKNITDKRKGYKKLSEDYSYINDTTFPKHFIEQYSHFFQIQSKFFHDLTGTSVPNSWFSCLS